MADSTMTASPRYCLDEPQPWLTRIDLLRRWWIAVNGDATNEVCLGGLGSLEFEEFRQSLLGFRGLRAGQTLVLGSDTPVIIHCLDRNAYALVGSAQGAELWHLLDRESLESLLMSAHPSWQNSRRALESSSATLERSLTVLA